MISVNTNYSPFSSLLALRLQLIRLIKMIPSLAVSESNFLRLPRALCSVLCFSFLFTASPISRVERLIDLDPFLL